MGEGVEWIEGKLAPDWHTIQRSFVTLKTKQVSTGLETNPNDIWQVDIRRLAGAESMNPSEGLTPQGHGLASYTRGASEPKSRLIGGQLRKHLPQRVMRSSFLACVQS